MKVVLASWILLLALAASPAAAAVPAPPPFADLQRPVKILAVDGDRLSLGNVRWGFDVAPDGKLAARFRDTAVDVSKLKDIHFYLRPFPPAWLAAHGLLVFEFEEGVAPREPGGRACRNLILSVEPRYYAGQSYGYAFGAKSPVFFLVYQVSTLDDYLQVCRIIKSDRLLRYRLSLRPEQKRELFRNAMAASAKLGDHEIKYHVLMSNCINNLFYVINETLPMDMQYLRRYLRLFVNPNISLPYLSVKALRHFNLIDRELPPLLVPADPAAPVVEATALPAAGMTKSLATPRGAGLAAIPSRAADVEARANMVERLLREAVATGMHRDQVISLLGGGTGGFVHYLHVPGVVPGMPGSGEFVVAEAFLGRLSRARLATELDALLAGAFAGYRAAVWKRLSLEGPDVAPFLLGRLDLLARALREAHRTARLNRGR